MAQTVKNLPENEETRVQLLSQEDPLKKGMATHSSILAWRMPGTEEGRTESDTTEVTAAAAAELPPSREVENFG